MSVLRWGVFYGVCVLVILGFAWASVKMLCGLVGMLARIFRDDGVAMGVAMLAVALLFIVGGLYVIGTGSARIAAILSGPAPLEGIGG